MVHIPMTIVVDAIVSLGKFPSFARQRDFRKEVEAAQPPAGAMENPMQIEPLCRSSKTDPWNCGEMIKRTAAA